MDWRRPISAGACLCALAVATAGAGCGEQEATGPAASIHVVLPQVGPLSERSRDMLTAVELAVEQSGGEEGGRRIVVEQADASSQSDAARAARDAVADASAVAVIGGVESDGADSIESGLRNEGPLLVVPASDTDPRAEQEAGEGATAVIHTAPSLVRIGQATAVASLQRVDEIAVGSMPAATRAGFAQAAARDGLETSRLSGAHRCAPTAAGVDPAGARIARAKIFCEGQLYLAADAPDGAYKPWNGYGGNGYLVTPALAYEDLPPAGRRFYDEFREREGRWPDRWAIFAYEAAGLVLQSIKDAEAQTGEVTRASVRDAAFTIHSRFGPVGRYDVLPNGQTTLNTVSVRRLPLPDGTEKKRESADDQVIEVTE